MPGVLKNAIDSAARPGGTNAFAGKPAGVLGISVGAIGTALAQQHLRNTLAYLDAPTLGQPEVFMQMKDGLLRSAEHTSELQSLMRNLVCRLLLEKNKPPTSQLFISRHLLLYVNSSIPNTT